MTPTLDDRVTILEGKMEMLEANPQPGQNQAFSDNFKEVRADVKELRRDFKKFGDVQGQHTQTLDTHTGKLSEISSHLNHIDIDLMGFTDMVRDVKAQLTGRVERLDGRVEHLDSTVTGLRDNVTVIEVNLGEFKEEVAGRMDRLDGQMGQLDGRMDQIDATLAKILDRLPPKAE